jgi:hypothetical protein
MLTCIALRPRCCILSLWSMLPSGSTTAQYCYYTQHRGTVDTPKMSNNTRRNRTVTGFKFVLRSVAMLMTGEIDVSLNFSVTQ